MSYFLISCSEIMTKNDNGNVVPPKDESNNDSNNVVNSSKSISTFDNTNTSTVRPDNRMGKGRKKRIALLIANDRYDKFSDLNNPISDAKKLKEKLYTLGFAVNLQTNLTHRQLQDVVKKHSQEIISHDTSLDISLFFYSGHGTQISNSNYLIPIDYDEIRKPEELDEKVFPMRSVFESLKYSTANANLVIVDACRNDILPSTIKIPSQPPEMGNIQNTLITFATAPGSLAEDNSPYMRELLKYIDKPGFTVKQLFDTVAEEVNKSHATQTPWVLSPGLPEVCLVLPCGDISQPKPLTTNGNQKISSSTAIANIEFKKIDTNCTHTNGASCPAPFFLSTKEVTVRDFRLFVKTTGYRTDAENGKKMSDVCTIYANGSWNAMRAANWKHPGYENNDNFPVVCVTRNDAYAYVNWLTKGNQGNQRYRLPTEIEWEYVAKFDPIETYFAETYTNGECTISVNLLDQKYYSTYKIGKRAAHHCSDGFADVSLVGKYKANGLGIYDILGNVQEITCGRNKCGDEPEAYARGGSWVNSPRVLDFINYRHKITSPSSWVGFRIVRE
jgi:formylglycine-generating enzyme required for sulfatase activity